MLTAADVVALADPSQKQCAVAVSIAASIPDPAAVVSEAEVVKSLRLGEPARALITGTLLTTPRSEAQVVAPLPS